MFFSFFTQLYEDSIIRQAFKNICLEKMLIDGYFDMRKYESGKTDRLIIYANLKSRKSRFATLYADEYPKNNNDTAWAIWHKCINPIKSNNKTIALNNEDSDAIVYWVYQIFDKKERETITTYIFKEEKEFHAIECEITFKNGIPYNSLSVELEIINNISDFYNIIQNENLINNRLFYRGHSKANYLLIPSLLRSEKLIKNERKIYNELLIECPHNFYNCPSHLDKLVEMQHYGLPTRLLDITNNPLVALYFACESNPNNLGEIILISSNEDDIKYPNSDCVSILASLPLFSYKEQQSFFNAATSFTHAKFNNAITRLLHEVRQEKPSFLAQVKNNDLLSNYIVLAQKNKQRIVKQDGAFVICGLQDYNNRQIYNHAMSLHNLRYRKNGKTLVILVDNKAALLKELSTYGINKATLFPEIDDVASYIKDKYSK